MYFYGHQVETGDYTVMAISHVIVITGYLHAVSHRLQISSFVVPTEFLIVKHQQTDRKENNSSDFDFKGIVLFNFTLNHFPIFSNAI